MTGYFTERWYKMKLSLNLITERMNLEQGNYLLYTDGEKRYSKIAIYTPRQEELFDHVLYVSSYIPETQALHTVSGKPTGYLLLNIEETDWKEPDCEYLYIKQSVSFSEMFNRASEAIFMVQQQLNDLRNLVLKRAGLQKLIERIYDIFQNPAYLVDSSFKVLAIERQKHMREFSVTWRRLEDYGYMSLDLIANLVQSNELNTMESSIKADLIHSDYFYTDFINYNLRYQGSIQGHFFIVGMFHKITEGDIELAGDVGEIILQAILQDEQFQKKQGYIYEHFIKDLFAGNINEPSYIRQQIPYLNLKDGLFVIGKIVPEQTDELYLERIISQLERNSDVRTARYDGYILGLFSVPTIEAVSTLLNKLERLGRSLSYQAGISDYFHDIYEASLYTVQASTALDISIKRGTYGVINQYQDIALAALLDLDETEKKIFCAPEILEMQLYDKQHDTNYMDTLHAYLMNERGAMETAQVLNIHRNTLTYRIERMKELFHLQLESAPHRYRYFLSLEMMEMDRNR